MPAGGGDRGDRHQRALSPLALGNVREVCRGSEYREPGNARAHLERIVVEETDRTIVVSSHILPEVQQLADVVGIIAKGRLVYQGPLEQLLQASGSVRVRVSADEVDRAAAALAGVAGTQPTVGDDGWIAVAVAHERAAEVNRALAEHGIYASGLETGADLESIFLELTGSPVA